MKKHLRKLSNGIVRAKASELDVAIRATGTSEGAKKGWEERKSGVMEVLPAMKQCEPWGGCNSKSDESNFKRKLGIALEKHGVTKNHLNEAFTKHRSQYAGQVIIRPHHKSIARQLLSMGVLNDDTAKATDMQDKETIQASGTSEGVAKSWETRRQQQPAGMQRELERNAYGHADHISTLESHLKRSKEYQREPLATSEAARLHREHLFHAEKAHESHEAAEGVVRHNSNEHRDAEYKEQASKLKELAGAHESAASKLESDYALEDYTPSTKASEQSTSPTIHCRDSGSTLPAKSKWEAGEPVDFQWLPGGVHTISAGFESSPSGSIELTVECVEQTAEAVQASYEDWTQQSRQEPFGCVEHREEEAAFRLPKATARFAWKDDPEPGVFCTAVPTELGARNVNGGMHRSFSPSFSTDAEYAKARMSCCKKAASVCKCSSPGQMQFPVGARGSKSNPAQVTGVAFSVGSLTNKPAFKQIMPVKAKHIETQDVAEEEEIVQAAWSDAARRAAAEARRHSGLAKEHSLMISMDGKPRANADAYAKTKEAHKASQATSKETGKGGPDQDAHNYAATAHRKAADAHAAAGDSRMAELHKNAAEAHKKASKQIHEETWAKASQSLSEAIRAYALPTLDEAIRAAETLSPTTGEQPPQAAQTNAEENH